MGLFYHNKTGYRASSRLSIVLWLFSIAASFAFGISVSSFTSFNVPHAGQTESIEETHSPSVKRLGDEPNVDSCDRRTKDNIKRVVDDQTSDTTESSLMDLHEYHSALAEEFVKLTLRKIEPFLPLRQLGLSTESIVNRQQPYMLGAIDALQITAPELMDSIAESIEEHICNNEVEETQLLLFSRYGQVMPEMITSRAFDCLFMNHREEDSVLWNAIDAWRISGFPETDVIKRIVKTASDPRTIERFRGIKDEEEILARNDNELLEETPEEVAERIAANTKLGTPEHMNKQ